MKLRNPLPLGRGGGQRSKENTISALRAFRAINSPEAHPQEFTKYVRRAGGIDAYISEVTKVLPIHFALLSHADYLHKPFLKYNDEKETFTRLLTISKPIGLLFVDEANACPVHSIYPTIFNSSKVVICGDLKQMELTTCFSDKAIKLFESNHYPTSEDKALFSPLRATAYSRAAKTIDREIAYNFFLHRRSQPSIVELFSSIAEYGLISTQTSFPAEAELIKLQKFNGGNNLTFCNVEGIKTARGKMSNIAEINAINIILDKLKDSGYDLTKDIAILTPFNAQKNVLMKQFGEILGHTQETQKIGLIYDFQSFQYKIVILSTAISTSRDSDAVLNTTPNMLNIAISRAESLFILVGNKVKLSSP